jgi:hypothetical protein
MKVKVNDPVKDTWQVPDGGKGRMLCNVSHLVLNGRLWKIAGEEG